MAVIDQFDPEVVINEDGGLIPALSKHFWEWYSIHQDDKVASVKAIFITINVKVRNLHSFFVILFGSPTI